jgi:hypothetical protein
MPISTYAMRFEELTYRIDGRATTVPFHRKFTVVSGLSDSARREWAERLVAGLEGEPAGSGFSLVFVDGLGSRLRLVRDHRGATTITHLDSGEDLTAQLGDGGHIDWFSLGLGLDGRAAEALMLLEPAALERAGGNSPGLDSPELAEARAVLARVDGEYQAVMVEQRRLATMGKRIAELDHLIRNFDEELARRRHGQAFWRLQRLEAELALHNGAEPTERLAAEAALEAARTAGERQAAGIARERARAAFGCRRLLDPQALERALALPADVPEGLETLQAAYLAAGRRRAELQAGLDEGAASELPTPSAPWVLSLARSNRAELWAQAERVRLARIRAAELSMGLGGTGQHRGLVSEIESAHHAVEQAERELASARVRRLAVSAKRRLAKAKTGEQDVLNRAGLVSWLAFQMRRIDVLLEPDALEALRVAELEHQLAAAAWAELAGDVDPETALAARPEVEHYGAELAGGESGIEATEALHRELFDEVEPAYARALGALLDACRPFDADPEHATDEISAIVSEARHARLQRDLDEAESAAISLEAQLEVHLAAAGLPGPGDLSGRVEAVRAKAAEVAVQLEAVEASRSVEEVEADLAQARTALARLSRRDWDEDPLVLASDAPDPDTQTLTEERARLVQDLERAQRARPDVDRLADRCDALKRRVAILETSSGAGSPLLSFEQTEMLLLGRVAQNRRVGPESEPVPLLIDDALAGFARHDKRRLLDLLTRLGEASQVVYLTDDPETLEWAGSRAAEGRVGLLHPESVGSVA